MKCIVVYQVMEKKIIPQISFKNTHLPIHFFQRLTPHILTDTLFSTVNSTHTYRYFVISLSFLPYREVMLTSTQDRIPEIINHIQDAMSETYKLILHLEPIVGNDCPLVQKLKMNIFNKISIAKIELIEYQEYQGKNITSQKTITYF